MTLHTLVETSGTTGTAKGVVHRMSTLVENARAFNEHMGFTGEETWYHCFPTDYTAGVLNLLIAPAVSGANVVMGETFGPETAFRFWHDMNQAGADAVWLAPDMAEAIVAVDRGDFGRHYAQSVDLTVCVGTGPLDGEVERRWRDRYGVPLLESYGLSELLFVTATPADRAAPGTAGTPLPGVEVRIRDTDSHIMVKTPYRMAGYLEGGTVSQRDGEWFDTGDVGALQGGELLVHGRDE